MKYDKDKFDPKTMFIKRRGGKIYMFDKQIRLWRKRGKSRGVLKDSKHKQYGTNGTQPALKKNFFE